MNRIDRLTWNRSILAASLLLAFGSNAWALPTGGAVSAGAATITAGPGTTTIGQATQNVAINWQGFSIGQGEAVRFVQPSSSAVALNRVVGSDPSSILGSLSANGKVFLVNPNGILFGSGAQVNVGGLVASTLNISDADFMAGRHKFAGAGNGTVVNQGSITAADGGYVALLGASVSNEGSIVARLGTVALAAGSSVTLDVAGDGLLNVAIDQGAMNALVQNGGLIQADGGRVLMSAQGAGALLQTVVNNTGVVQAQTLQNRNGTILLLGDMQNGTVNVGGTLDASAPNGGNGGFIETSAAYVHVASSVRITTTAPQGVTGTWLIDPLDFTIGSAPGDDIAGVTLSGQLNAASVTITTTAGPGLENGDIFVNDAITWNPGAGNPTTLTLNALRDVTINQAITATNGNLVVCCGRDVTVSAVGAITTTDGSVLLAGGRNAIIDGAMSTTRGNMAICAGHDVLISSALTLVDPTLDPTRSLGLSPGMTLSAGLDGTGPGVAGGTVTFAPAAPLAAVTRAPVVINYNPISYAAPTDYSLFFTLVGPGAPLTSRMLVFPAGGDKVFDGTTATVLSSLKGLPAGVSLVAGPGSAANFDTAAVGLNKTISFTGYTLAGADADDFALATACCGPIVSRTTGNITAIAPVVPIVPLVTPTPGAIPPELIPVTAILPIFLTGVEDVGMVDQPIETLGLQVTQAPAPQVRLFRAPPPPPQVAPPAPVVVPAPPVERVPPRPARQERN